MRKMRESKNNKNSKKSSQRNQMKQIRKNRNIVGSKMMAGMLVLCVSAPFAQGLGFCAPVYATESSAQTNTNNKEEVVYIMLDAEGVAGIKGNILIHRL